MLKILDLSRDFSSLQAGLTELALLHQVPSLSVKDGELVMHWHFSQLVVDSAMMLDFGQGGPIVQTSDLFSEGMIL